jgi:hypothetical protein
LLFPGFGISLFAAQDLGELPVKTLDMTATDAVAPRTPVLDLGAVAPAPNDEPTIERWPGWARVGILLGGTAALWAGIGWAAVTVFRLG